MRELVKIFDTTLRDGEQSPGATMNIAEKVRIAEQLEKLNVDIIEAGFPISSEGDFEAVRTISKTIKRSEVAAWPGQIRKTLIGLGRPSREPGFLGSIPLFQPPTSISNTNSKNQRRKSSALPPVRSRGQGNIPQMLNSQPWMLREAMWSSS